MHVAAIAEFRHALAQFRRAISLPQLRLSAWLGFVVLMLPQLAVAQHCGRIGYVVSMDSDSLSWEKSDAGFASVSPADTAKIRGSGCEGPLCRSRTPRPFAPGTFAGSPAISFPWTCTALAPIPPEPAKIARLFFTYSTFFEIPFPEPIPKPPRIG